MKYISTVKPYIRDFQRQRPLKIIAIFLFCYSLALSISPLVLNRSIATAPLWRHWLGFFVWLVAFAILNHRLNLKFPNYDKLLLQIVSLLVGWGLLTIWSLTETFGLRQTIWLIVTTIMLLVGLRYESYFSYLRRYKYIWLFSGLGLTALTFIFGTNPQGIGPRLWLGCCGLYLQPSEPLKLLLIIFLAAYLADRQPLTKQIAPLLAPTAIMLAGALLMLLAQRDLGAAFIFLLIYTFVIYVATEKRAVLWFGAPILALAGYLGSLLFDVVQLRMEAWINPWLDPSGRSYQIVQSLIAIASGGLVGRGAGLGNPEVVPVSHSDFIFTSIFEQTGLLGAIALIICFSMLCMRGLQIAASSEDIFHRYLATGLVAYFSMQTILIISGNIRLLPLTGVTIPFVSYGGSSLMTSFFALFLLIHLSQKQQHNNSYFHDPSVIISMGKILLAAFTLIAVTLGWWSLVRGPELLTRTDNPRRAIADRYVSRGKLLDRNGITLVETIGEIGSLQRNYLNSSGGSVIGYTHPIYGLAGLEATLDEILRGLDFQAPIDLWTNHLFYGQPPAGLDVQLTLDSGLQARAHALLSDQIGALILMDADSGEILSLVSNPSFDQNMLTDTWSDLIQDQNGPLVNRVTQGSYQPGTALSVFVYAGLDQSGSTPVPTDLSHAINGFSMDCATTPVDSTQWADVIAAGCPGASAQLGLAIGSEELLNLYNLLGFYDAPNIRLPMTTSSDAPLTIPIPEAAAIGQAELTLSPLQLAIAAATFSNGGMLPAAHIANAVNQTQAGFISLKPLGQSQRVFTTATATRIAQSLKHNSLPIWQSLGIAINGPDQFVSWYLGGSLPGETNSSLVVVVMLEIDFPTLAESIGQAMLRAAMQTE